MQLLFVRTDLKNQVNAFCFQFDAFKPDHFSQQLVFKAFRRDSEVDDGGFDAYLGYVVRVRQFGRQVVFEVAVVGHVLVTKPQQPLLTLLHQLFPKDWFEGGVEFFLDVLHEHCLSVTNGILKDFEEVGLTEFGDVHVAVLVHVTNPLVGLTLWINDEWPSAAVEDEDAVIS